MSKKQVLLSVENGRTLDIEHKETPWNTVKSYGWFDKDETHFDGHHVLWSFDYHASNYMKESELSGDEWRKGGTIRIFRNGKQVWEEFCREPFNAAIRIPSILTKCIDFDWDQVVVGRKVYYKDEPAIIRSLVLDQGCIILEPDGMEEFRWAAHDQESLKEDPKHTPYNDKMDHVKVEVLNSNIWWWRK